ncbi:MAG: hypothetical protein LC715_02540 [Gammaproteobacteria bacterium]|nr:hypothetical protein [Gammaproteobacteria bacterium]
MATASMFVHRLFNGRTSFNSSRLRATFAPRKPRHPLLRFALGLIGLGLLALLLVFGVFIGAAMVAAGLLYRLWQQRGKPIAHDRPQVKGYVDGEYRVIAKPGLR